MPFIENIFFIEEVVGISMQQNNYKIYLNKIMTHCFHLLTLILEYLGLFPLYQFSLTLCMTQIISPLF